MAIFYLTTAEGQRIEQQFAAHIEAKPLQPSGPQAFKLSADDVIEIIGSLYPNPEHIVGCLEKEGVLVGSSKISDPETGKESFQDYTL
jgi:hypothetical protein